MKCNNILLNKTVIINIKKGVSFVELKNIKTSNLENDELLNTQKQVESFLKFLNGEYETVKKLEEENS